MWAEFWLILSILKNILKCITIFKTKNIYSYLLCKKETPCKALSARRGWDTEADGRTHPLSLPFWWGGKRSQIENMAECDLCCISKVQSATLLQNMGGLTLMEGIPLIDIYPKRSNGKIQKDLCTQWFLCQYLAFLYWTISHLLDCVNMPITLILNLELIENKIFFLKVYRYKWYLGSACRHSLPSFRACDKHY